MDETNERKYMSSRMKKVIIGVAAVIVVATVVMGALIVFEGAKTHKTTSAAAVITAFNDQAGKGSFLVGVKTTADAGSRPIYVKNAAIDAYLQVSTTNNVSLVSDQGFTRTQVSDIQTSMKKFLKDQGLDAITLPDSNLHTILLGYAKDDVNCQLQEVPGADALTTIRFSCANSSDYSDEAATITKLLNVWKDEKITQYSIFSLDITKNDTYSVAVLNAMPTDTSSHYIVFVEDKGAWKYIGDASTGNAVVPNEKYIINQDIETALKDPNYGAFLHSVLFVTTKK